MHAGFIGVAGAQRISLSGVLTTTSASSPVTSSTRTITGNGSLQFDSVATDGGAPEYSKNGGAWTTITDGGTVAVVSTDTIAVRAALAVVGFDATFNLRNHASGALIEAVTLLRS